MSKLLRFFDILLSAIGLIIFLPVLIVLICLGFFVSGSPIFRQERLGLGEKPFILLKFRTMHINTPSISTHLAKHADVTQYGKILRKTKLDELPQLWNVLKGEMSLVGPRPGLPNQMELTASRKKMGVFTVRPGITGLSQLSGIDMSQPRLLAQTDAQMISEMSFRKYFKIIFLTVLGKGWGDRLIENK